MQGQTVTNVFSPGYVDELVQRSRGTVNESFDEFTQEWAVTSSSSDTLYVQQDANFNVTSVTDTGGTVQERYLYDPYGKQAYLSGGWGSRSSSSYGMVYLHQGGRYNAINKLYSFRFRDYSADLGRWMQQDPAGYVDGASLYQAVVSSPVTWVDPWGLRGFIKGNGRIVNLTGKPILIWSDEHGYGVLGIGQSTPPEQDWDFWRGSGDDAYWFKTPGQPFKDETYFAGLSGYEGFTFAGWRPRIPAWWVIQIPP